MTKILAMYLPQFHRVPENDAWWGEGFTDWVAVKKAKPLYEGHKQPRVPQNDNYYDLMEKCSMKWQAELMHKYGVDGMCMYHYWFGNGRQMLEKPAENLLEWKDIDMPFCFCWANQTWARSWSKLSSKTIWTDTFEPENGDRNEEKGLLIEQIYGKEDEWRRHFEYFLQFFLDRRYIRVENKPVIIIYMPEEIPCLPEMIGCWRNMAKEKGLSGLHIIGENCSHDMSTIFDGELFHEPARSFVERGRMGYSEKAGDGSISYAEIWEQILLAAKHHDTHQYLCGFVNYDDSPRRGKLATIVEHGSPKQFKDYMKRLLMKSNTLGAEIVFINAWNEWGEGMYLEPDNEYGDAYLEAIKKTKEETLSVIDNYDYSDPVYAIDKIEKLQNKYDLCEGNLQFLDKWMILREKGKIFGEYIKETIHGKIGIYGYGILGKHLYNELTAAGIDVCFIIDKKPLNLSGIKCLTPDQYYPKDCSIIIASIYYFEEIQNLLCEKGIAQVYSIFKLMNDMENELNEQVSDNNICIQQNKLS